MRVAFHSVYRMSIDSMSRGLSRASDLRQKIVSARKFTRPSEDPLGAERSVMLNRTLSSIEQYKSSAGSALLYLQSSESDLLEINILLRQAKDIALSQRNATSDETSTDVSASEIKSIRDQITAVLNHQVNGRYLFAGHLTDAKPFVEIGGAIQYQGDDGEIRIRVGRDANEVTNIPGSDLLSFGVPSLTSSVFLQPAVTGSTPLSSLNGGQGIPPGTFDVDDGLGNVVTIDTSTMSTVQDVLDAINNSSSTITAQIDSTSTRIQFVAGSPTGLIHVTDTVGDAAAELGVLGKSFGVITGRGLNPALDATTPLSDIPQIGSLGAITVVENGVPTIVDFTAPPPVTTMGEMITRFNQSVGELTIALNAAGTGFEITGAEPFSIEASGVDTTAAQLGLIGDGEPAQLFASLEDLFQALTDSDADAIDDVLGDLDDVLAGFHGLEGIIGGRVRRVDAALSLLEQREVQTFGQLSQTVDLDMAAAISQFSEAQIVYEAALATASSLSDLSLLRFL